MCTVLSVHFFSSESWGGGIFCDVFFESHLTVFKVEKKKNLHDKRIGTGGQMKAARPRLMGGV